MTQSITLFDEVDDDDFDGELGEDDEEMPMIECGFTINQVGQKESTPSPEKMPASQSNDVPQMAHIAPDIPELKEAQSYTNPKRVVKSSGVKPLH